MIYKEEYFMSKYADDTLVILDGTEQFLQHCIEEIISGLKINLEKNTNSMDRKQNVFK